MKYGDKNGLTEIMLGNFIKLNKKRRYNKNGIVCIADFISNEKVHFYKYRGWSNKN